MALGRKPAALFLDGVDIAFRIAEEGHPEFIVAGDVDGMSFAFYINASCLE